MRPSLGLWRHGWQTLGCGMIAAGTLWADEQPAAAPAVTPPSAPAVTPAVTPDQPAAPAAATDEKQIQSWLADLDSDSFEARQLATEKLIAAGQAVIPAVQAAATGENLEVTTRSIEVLKGLTEKGGSETVKAAKAALESLSKSENKQVARRAGQALQPEPPVQAQNPNVQGFPGGRIIVQNGGIPIQIMPMPAQVLPANRAARQQIQIANNNGNRTVEVTENGRKVRIEQNEKGIKLTTTEPAAKAGDPDVTKTVEAKDVEELKKNHPEAYKQYEKYMQGRMGNIQINGFGIGGGQIQIQVAPGGAIPVPVPAPQIPQRPVPAQNGKEGLAKARAHVQKMANDLRNQVGNDPNQQKIIEQLEKTIQELEELEKKLPE